MATENTEISEKMKRFRKLRNMSQNDLAEASGINISTIKKYKAGFRNPKTGQIKKCRCSKWQRKCIFDIGINIRKQRLIRSYEP